MKYKFMRFDRTILQLAIMGLFIFSCTNPISNKLSSQSSDLDSTKVLERAVQHLFDSKQLPKAFADTPLMIIRSKDFTAIKPFKVNGVPVVFLEPSALSDTTLINWQNPKPVVEIRNFNVQNDTVAISLMFNAVNQEYELLAIPENDGSYKIKTQGVREY